jgi:hypothetical protein
MGPAARARISERRKDSFTPRATVAQESSAPAANNSEEAATNGWSRCFALVSVGGEGKALSKVTTEMSKAWPQGTIAYRTLQPALLAAHLLRTCCRTQQLAE